jgi:purine-binding chemotaxis protein CheW
MSRQETEVATSKAGKYLTFELGNEAFALEITKVQEIIGILPVTRVPKLPDFVRGVINLRGKVIPVIDLRRKFGFGAREDTARTCIIVAQINRDDRQVITGILVDEVCEVLDVAADQIDAAPDFGAAVNTDFIPGMGRIGDRVVMLLDVDRVLSSGEVDSVELIGTPGRARLGDSGAQKGVAP